MLQAKCIQKFRNKQNKIIGYRIQDQRGYTNDMYPDQLKAAIYSKDINVINLTLTADGRLIDTTPKQQVVPAPKQQSKYTSLRPEVQAAIAEAAPVRFARSHSPNTLYNLACQAGFQDIVVLSQENCVGRKSYINTHFKNYKDALRHPEATIFITNMSFMFQNCREQTLDLSSFNTSNVTDMTAMFTNCEAQNLNLSSFDTSHVTSMESMFYGCKAKSLDLRNFNTSIVQYMYGMFEECKAQTIDLSSFDTSYAVNTTSMFKECESKIKATDQKVLEEYKNRVRSQNKSNEPRRRRSFKELMDLQTITK